jgi:hypothetical protein
MAFETKPSTNKTITTMVFDLVNKIQEEQGEYDPITLSEKLIDLSRLYCGLTGKIADLEHAYQVLLGKEMDKDFDKPFNKIELRAKQTDEYYQLKKSLALEKSVITLIRASNRYIKLKENEMSTGKFQ